MASGGWEKVRQYVISPVADREPAGKTEWRNAEGARYVTYTQDGAKVVTHVTADPESD